MCITIVPSHLATISSHVEGWVVCFNMMMIPMQKDTLLTSYPLESTVDCSIRPQTISKPSNKAF